MRTVVKILFRKIYGAFLVNIGHILHNLFLFLLNNFISKYRWGRLSKIEDLRDFHVNSCSSSF